MERPVELDLSALSPAEYDAYLGFAGELRGELERKGGQMRFAEAAMVIRKWFEFEPEKEDEIRCFFPQKTQLGGMRLGSCLAVLRLLAHVRAYPNTTLISDHVFTQTRPLPSLKTSAVTSPLSRSNPFRKAETPQTTTIDTSPHFLSSDHSSPLQSLVTAVQSPATITNRSPPFDSNPFRLRTRSGADAPVSPSSATAASMSPPLPPRPQDRDAASKGPPPPPPPKHHSRQQTLSDVNVDSAPKSTGRAKLNRSDSSPPTSRPATVRRPSAAMATSATRSARPKIQSTTSSGYGTWIITPDGTGGSTAPGFAAPAPAPKPKLFSSTHLGIDTTLRGGNLSPQPTGASMAASNSFGGGDDDARPRMARPPSDVSVGSSTGHRHHGGATGLTPGMGLQYQTIASSTSPRLGTIPDPGPPAPPPPPRKKKAPTDTRSQPETSAGPFGDHAAPDDDDAPGPWSALGRSKTIGHAAAAKGPPPAPPPRRTSTMNAGRLHNPHAASLEDVARQPTGDAESSFSPPLPPQQNHRRASSNSQTAALRNFKALETGLATKAAHLRQDSRNIVKDIQDGWSRRHGKPDERQGLVGSKARKARPRDGDDGRWAEEDASGDEGGWDRLE